MLEEIRSIAKKVGIVPSAIDTLAADADLYGAGMTSCASVQFMLALEEAFDVEFPEHMLNRRTFASLDAVGAAVGELVGERA